MQTNASVADLIPPRPSTCLLCGAPTPSTARELERLGWTSWQSHERLRSQEERVSELCACPSCASNPMFVATTLLKYHGLAYLDEWLRSVNLSCQLGTSH